MSDLLTLEEFEAIARHAYEKVHAMEPLTVMFRHDRTIEKFQGIGPAEALAIWSSGLSVWHIWCWTADAIQEIADIYDPLLCPYGDSSAIWAWVVGLDPFEDDDVCSCPPEEKCGSNLAWAKRKGLIEFYELGERMRKELERDL